MGNRFGTRMILASLAVSLSLAASAPVVVAQTAVPAEAQAQAATLADTMRLAELMAVMQDEGGDYGASIDTDMLGGSGGARWQETVARIYDAERMQAHAVEALARAVAEDPGAMAEAQAFFASPLGQKVVDLEISARKAMMEDSVKDAAELTSARMQADGAPRIDLLRRYAEANDLLERNVAGAMTVSLAFFKGMASQNPQGLDMSEADMLSSVYGQEPQIREDTTVWLYSFMVLAYEPLSDAELEAYTAFSETPAGQRINAALFDGFDKAFEAISTELGSAAALAVMGQEI